MRKIKDEELLGKTINSIDNSSVNMLKLNFTDGTSIELFSEVSGPLGLTAIVVSENNQVAS